MVQNDHCDSAVAGVRRRGVRFLAGPAGERPCGHVLGGGFVRRRLLGGDLPAAAQAHVGLCAWTRVHPRPVDLDVWREGQEIQGLSQRGARGGYQEQLRDCASPLFSPLYALLVVLVFAVGQLAWNWQPYLAWFHLLLGAAYAFHVTLTWHILKNSQSDISEQGYLFSAVVISWGISARYWRGFVAGGQGESAHGARLVDAMHHRGAAPAGADVVRGERELNGLDGLHGLHRCQGLPGWHGLHRCIRELGHQNHLPGG